jgi:tetratricopeptide (TPR) repeat protein
MELFSRVQSLTRRDAACVCAKLEARRETTDGRGMSKREEPKSLDESVEAALLDADLFVKYKAPQRAVERLQEAIAHWPRSIVLREKLREVAFSHGLGDEAARQCLMLVNLYISRENFDAAHERLLEAKHIDPRINIAPGLDAIRRARRPDLHQQSPAPPLPSPTARRPVTFAGDLSTVNVFDAVQVIENSRLTGALAIESPGRRGRVLFNEGRIVGADCGDAHGTPAFRLIVEVTAGAFDFEKSPTEFPVTIQALSNTNLMLDTLRQLDEEKNGNAEV